MPATDELASIPIVMGEEARRVAAGAAGERESNEETSVSDQALLNEKLEEHDDFSKDVFQCVSENTYGAGLPRFTLTMLPLKKAILTKSGGAAILAYIFVRKADVAIYCTIPLVLSWLVQIGFITFLSGAYLDSPPLSADSLHHTDPLPQLISVGYFILSMLSNLEWLFVSGYITLFSSKYRKGDAIFDLKTKSLLLFNRDGSFELLTTPNSVQGDFVWVFRVAAFAVCTMAEAAVWVAVLLVGVQYIMWSATQGTTKSEQAASVLWATVSFTWITSVDEKVYAHVLPSRFKARMKEVQFQVKPFSVAEIGAAGTKLNLGGYSPTKVVPQFKALTNSARFVLPSLLLVGAAVGAVFAQREGVIIEWPRLD